MSAHSQQPFSKRFGHNPAEPPITVRDDAPEKLRYCVLQIANDKCHLSPSTLRDIVCGVLRERPNPNNWSPYPNIWGEVDDLVARCEWFKVYDIIEAIYASLVHDAGLSALFEQEVNQCYRELGIGWRLVNGLHETRGDDAFQATVELAKSDLTLVSLSTSTSELTEAIRDLSRRPEPDLSGAVHHAMAALEAAARRASGDAKLTLGDIIKRYPGLFPKPLDECASKAWGFASENARHGREDRNLTYEDAQLVVGLAVVLCSYVAAKINPFA